MEKKGKCMLVETRVSLHPLITPRSESTLHHFLEDIMLIDKS